MRMAICFQPRLEGQKARMVYLSARRPARPGPFPAKPADSLFALVFRHVAASNPLVDRERLETYLRIHPAWMLQRHTAVTACNAGEISAERVARNLRAPPDDERRQWKRAPAQAPIAMHPEPIRLAVELPQGSNRRLPSARHAEGSARLGPRSTRGQNIVHREPHTFGDHQLSEASTTAIADASLPSADPIRSDMARTSSRAPANAINDGPHTV